MLTEIKIREIMKKIPPQTTHIENKKKCNNGKSKNNEQSIRKNNLEKNNNSNKQNKYESSNEELVIKSKVRNMIPEKKEKMIINTDLSPHQNGNKYYQMNNLKFNKFSGENSDFDFSPLYNYNQNPEYNIKQYPKTGHYRNKSDLLSDFLSSKKQSQDSKTDSSFMTNYGKVNNRNRENKNHSNRSDIKHQNKSTRPFTAKKQILDCSDYKNSNKIKVDNFKKNVIDITSDGIEFIKEEKIIKSKKDNSPHLKRIYTVSQVEDFNLVSTNKKGILVVENTDLISKELKNQLISEYIRSRNISFVQMKNSCFSIDCIHEKQKNFQQLMYHIDNNNFFIEKINNKILNGGALSNKIIIDKHVNEIKFLQNDKKLNVNKYSSLHHIDNYNFYIENLNNKYLNDGKLLNRNFLDQHVNEIKYLQNNKKKSLNKYSSFQQILIYRNSSMNILNNIEELKSYYERRILELKLLSQEREKTINFPNLSDFEASFKALIKNQNPKIANDESSTYLDPVKQSGNDYMKIISGKPVIKNKRKPKSILFNTEQKN